MIYKVGYLTDFSKEEKEKAFSRLSLPQQAYIKKKPPEKAEQSICARILLSQIIKEKTGKDILGQIEFKEDKKPYIAGEPDFNISIAHSDNLVAAAFSVGSIVAIDIEKIRPISEKVINVTLNREEQNFLKLKGSQAFFMIWTARETLIKTGLYSYAEAQRFPFVNEDKIVPPFGFDLHQYTFEDFFVSVTQKAK